jgi:hypothetical protein
VCDVCDNAQRHAAKERIELVSRTGIEPCASDTSSGASSKSFLKSRLSGYPFRRTQSVATAALHRSYAVSISFLVRRRPLHAVDDEDFDRTSLRV